MINKFVFNYDEEFTVQLNRLDNNSSSNLVDTVNWGDGTIEDFIASKQNSIQSHTYSTGGTYSCII